jgi:hypothetical protein
MYQVNTFFNVIPFSGRDTGHADRIGTCPSGQQKEQQKTVGLNFCFASAHG